MALEQQDIQFIKAHVGEWLSEQGLAKPPVVYEVELRERMVRVEEELKYQRELIREGFGLMDKRFEAVDKRFEAMDRRFEELREDMNRRFEAMDRRFEVMDKRFEELREDMDKRFEAMDKRFEELREDMNKRFEAVDRRFEALRTDMERRFMDQKDDIRELNRLVVRFMFWSFGVTVAVGGLVVASLRYLLAAG